MSRPIHFEIHAADPKRAISFYADLFGWTFTKWAGPVDYWVIKTGDEGVPGINGGLLPRQGGGPAPMQALNAYVCTIDVADLDASLRRAGEVGGAVVLSKMPIPGIGWLAYLHDTEKNIFGVMQADTQAK